MPQRPFRFIHAADLHLDRPVHGLTESPEHLVDLLIDCPAHAAVKVFDAAIDRHVDFVVLSGGVINPRHASPYEMMLLADQFDRLNAAEYSGLLGPRPARWHRFRRHSQVVAGQCACLPSRTRRACKARN